jgi:hypothetical protein
LNDEKIDGLRKDVFSATVNRGLVYTAILEEMRCDEEGLDVKPRRCPLKEGWRMLDMSRDEVADTCRHADSFDHGFFGSIFDYSMDLWTEHADDSCILHFRPKRSPVG